ncbi:MAG: DNA-3-methyladenine glycosylase family protein [Planctomycetota bacterium]
MVTARAHLLRVDPVLAPVIRATPLLRPLRRRGSLFAHLVRVILAQQISVAAANSITARVAAACAGRITPATILALDHAGLRAAGCSGPKARSILALATDEAAGRLRLRGIGRLGDEDAHARLCAIRGIGPWTAEMVLLFRFGRPDVFSPGDIGLRRAVERLYELPRDLDERAWRARAAAISAVWRPHRSTACRYLWAWGDADIVYE